MTIKLVNAKPLTPHLAPNRDEKWGHGVWHPGSTQLRLAVLTSVLLTGVGVVLTLTKPPSLLLWLLFPFLESLGAPRSHALRQLWANIPSPQSHRWVPFPSPPPDSSPPGLAGSSPGPLIVIPGMEQSCQHPLKPVKIPPVCLSSGKLKPGGILLRRRCSQLVLGAATSQDGLVCVRLRKRVWTEITQLGTGQRTTHVQAAKEIQGFMCRETLSGIFLMSVLRVTCQWVSFPTVLLSSPVI